MRTIIIYEVKLNHDFTAPAISDGLFTDREDAEFYINNQTAYPQSAYFIIERELIEGVRQ